MTKSLKKELLDAMMNAGNLFFLRKVANSIGITQMSRAETEGVMKAFLLRRPDMTAYYDGGDKNLNSLFCGLWFAPATAEFEEFKDEDVR